MELLALAIAPAAILLFWVYHKDKYDREPMGLIFRIMAFGAVACIPAAILETLLEPFLMPGGEADPSGLSGLFLYTLLGVGLVEEGCKFFALKRNTWRSPHFNQRFDGIVYAVSASLGFAVLENILYVTTGGFSVGILRALTAVPMHCAFGVLMGVQYGRSRLEGVPNTPQRQNTPIFSQIPVDTNPPSWNQPWWATDPIRTSRQGATLQSEPILRSEDTARLVMGPPSPAGDQPEWLQAAQPCDISVALPIGNGGMRLWKVILIPTILHGLYDFFAMASSISAWFLAGLAVVLLGSVAWAAILVVREARNPY